MSFAGPVTFRNAGALRGPPGTHRRSCCWWRPTHPYLTPRPHRGRADELYCLPWTVRGLAEIRGTDEQRLADILRRNSERVFGFVVGC